MKRKLWFWIIALVAIISLLFLWLSWASPRVSSEDTDVINASLEKILSTKSNYVIQSTAEDPSFWLRDRDAETLKGIANLMTAQLLARNAREPDVSSVPVRFEGTWADKKSLNEMGDDYWTAFHKRFPSAKGVVAFSLPGYNFGHTEALCYAEFAGGGLYAWGGIMLFHKVHGKWVFVRYITEWVS